MHKFIKNLKVFNDLDQIFQVVNISKRTSQKGSIYYQLDLKDKSGKISAKIWSILPGIESVTENSFALVKGRVDAYKGTMQVIISDISPAAPEEVDPEVFTASGGKDLEALIEELRGFLAKIENPFLVELTKLFLEDEVFIEKFKIAPAAVEIHHAYRGGLLEHTVNMMNLAERITGYYYTAGEPKEPLLNKDLLMVGVFLHDAGKIKEYEMKIMPQMMDEGKLLGHTILGIMMLEDKIKQIENFPDQLRIVLEHLIGSHHGQREYGAPVLPMTPEAMVLHYLDNLDARMGEYLLLTQKSANGNWTEWSKSLERRFYIAPPDGDSK